MAAGTRGPVIGRIVLTAETPPTRDEAEASMDLGSFPRASVRYIVSGGNLH